MSENKTKKSEAPKRLNRMSLLSEALGKGLDPVFAKRGFATKDIVAQWQAIVPHPYSGCTLPDKLAWPRGEASAEGAVLHVRCAEAHRMAFEHEAPQLVAAVNRYFGYVLVSRIRLSAIPFSRHSDERPQAAPKIDKATEDRIDQTVRHVQDEGVREALRQWGRAMSTPSTDKKG